MTEELKASLKAALLKEGLSEGLLDNLNVTEEAQIQGVIDNLKVLATPIALTEEELSKNPLVQSIADKRVTAALKKAKGEPEPPKPPTPPTGELTAESIAELIKQGQQPLLAQIEALTGQRTLETKQLEAQTLINGSGLSDFEKPRALSRINFDSETTVEDQLTALVSEETERLQFLKDNGKLASAPPAIGGGLNPTDAEIDAIVAKM